MSLPGLMPTMLNKDIVVDRLPLRPECKPVKQRWVDKV